MKMDKIKFPETLTLKVIEDYFYNNLKIIKESKNIRIDFQDVEYIEIGCFFYVISLMSIIKNKGGNVILKLPKSIKVRNIIRLWRVPIVLKEIIKVPFKDLVEQEDLKYFGENKNLLGDFYKKLSRNEEGLLKLFQLNFFSLYNLPFNDESNKKNTLINEPNKWEDSFIQAVLKKHLKKFDSNSENLIPRIIIYECLTNAYRHPNSKSLLTLCMAFFTSL